MTNPCEVTQMQCFEPLFLGKELNDDTRKRLRNYGTSQLLIGKTKHELNGPWLPVRKLLLWRVHDWWVDRNHQEEQVIWFGDSSDESMDFTIFLMGDLQDPTDGGRLVPYVCPYVECISPYIGLKHRPKIYGRYTSNLGSRCWVYIPSSLTWQIIEAKNIWNRYLQLFDMDPFLHGLKFFHFSMAKTDTFTHLPLGSEEFPRKHRWLFGVQSGAPGHDSVQLVYPITPITIWFMDVYGTYTYSSWGFC